MNTFSTLNLYSPGFSTVVYKNQLSLFTLSNEFLQLTNTKKDLCTERVQTSESTVTVVVNYAPCDAPSIM